MPLEHYAYPLHALHLAMNRNVCYLPASVFYMCVLAARAQPLELEQSVACHSLVSVSSPSHI